MEAVATVPVALDVDGPDRGVLGRVVEGALGWQVVAADDPVLPPRFVLTDVARAPVHLGGRVPVVLLVRPDDDPLRVACVAGAVAAVLDRVPDAAGLQQLAGQLVVGRGVGRAAWCTVAAGAGGVGATTVATALAGLRAWRHGPTLVAVRGPSHQQETPVVGGAELASPAVWAAAAPVVAVDDCRVVGLRPGPPPADAGPVPLVLEVALASAPADVVVVRPDRAGLAAAADAGATAAIVLVGRGAVTPTQFRGTGQRLVELPWSARVAAAAAAGRLPADVPGTWLAPLAPVVDDLERRDAA